MPSVEDTLHLEKRWHTLPGAGSGAVALEAAKALLGTEVLAVRGAVCGAVGVAAAECTCPPRAASPAAGGNPPSAMHGPQKTRLQDEPLELVARRVLPGAPATLSKRQFLALAHVAEVAQRNAFDLVTAEDAQRSQVRGWVVA